MAIIEPIKIGYSYIRQTTLLKMDKTAQVQQLQNEIADKRKELNELIKSEKKEIKDYTFLKTNNEEVQLSDLFGDKDEIHIIQNMGKRCVYCTLWADGFNGVIDHLNDRIPTFLCSPDAPEVQKEFAESRNWNFNMISAANNTFKQDTGFATEDGRQMPGCIIITKDADGKLYETARDTYGPGDNYSGIWHVIDLLEDGVNGWAPKYKY